LPIVPLSQLATRGHVRCHFAFPDSLTESSTRISIGNERTCALPPWYAASSSMIRLISIGNERTCALPLDCILLIDLNQKYLNWQREDMCVATT